MRIDVLALQRFYGSRLGDAARRMAARRIEAVWPGAPGQDMLGLGYALPYLEPYRAEARRVVALMPAAQGVERWPGEGRVLSALGDEARLPFMDAIFDRVLIVHALEEAEAPQALLREIWRVMAPEGRLLIVAANRGGLWARADSTPFGHGRPFSRRQLAAMLSDSLFEPMASARALYAPPLDWPILTSLAEGLERAGELIAPAFGGLVLMEAVKRLYADVGRAPGKVLLARSPARAKPSKRSETRGPETGARAEGLDYMSDRTGKAP
jgi:SAM-dependent methyltransferase